VKRLIVTLQRITVADVQILGNDGDYHSQGETVHRRWGIEV
jgi:hypothetical protein